jgi:hypothetical protein
MKLALTTAAFILTTSTAFAGGHSTPMVEGMDQDMSGGTVTASKIIAPANGWLVVHKTADGMKPGPVIGYSPLRAGENTDIVAILTEPVATGEKVMLMLHGEDGGMAMGGFEYSLGAKEDGPLRVDGNLVMAVVSAM